jgi:hypothetical protein
MKRAALVVALTAFAASVLSAQQAAKPAPAAAKKTGVPRTPDGKPDLQGNWSNATITMLERAPGTPLTMPEEEAAALEKRVHAGLAQREEASDPDRLAPPAGGATRPVSPGGSEPTLIERLWQAGAGPVGGYNSFWIDPGERVLRIDGKARTSMLVDPPDGRVPALTPEGRERQAAAAAARRKAGGDFDHPELRPLAERCIMSFGNNAGPPMLPNYFYNNNYTIVQTPDNVMIMTEMVHDARVIRIGPNAAPHPPAQVRQWMGDSIGRWEGDTLVVETTNFHRLQGFRGSWENLKVTERLTRVDAQTIHYKFTVEDPQTFTAPFSGELAFNAMKEPVYEYSCHEGNYGLEGVMRGARVQENPAAAKKP